MVNKGPSQGCLVCRTRRIRCDLGQPSCQNCSRRRVPCPGPRGLRIRDETASFTKRAPEKPCQELKPKSLSSSTASVTTSELVHGVHGIDQASSCTHEDDRYIQGIEKLLAMNYNIHGPSDELFHLPQPQEIDLSGKNFSTDERSCEAATTYDSNGDMVVGSHPTADTLHHIRLEPIFNRPTLELLHHSSTVFWPGLYPGSSDKLLPVSWVTKVMAEPILFHSMMWAAAVHMSIMKGCETVSSDALRHQRQAIHCLTSVLAETGAVLDDEHLLCMLALATPETGTDALADRAAMSFDPPLQDLLWLNVYSRSPFVKEHCCGLLQVVRLRGGFDVPSMLSFNYQFHIMDTINSTLRLGKPRFPLCQQYQQLVQIENRHTTFGHEGVTVQAESSAMCYLQRNGVANDVIELFLTMRAYTDLLHQYCTSQYAMQNLPRLGLHRNILQHQLLSSLPVSHVHSDGDDNNKNDTLENSEVKSGLENISKMTGILQLGMLVFALGVIFPVQDHKPIMKAVGWLKDLVQSEPIFVTNFDYHEIAIWACMMGALGSVDGADTDLKPFFIRKLADIELARWHVKSAASCRSWVEIEGVLEPYLWLPSACTFSASLMWTKVRHVVDQRLHDALVQANL